MEKQGSNDIQDIRDFYDSVYYKSARPPITPSRHHRQLAQKLGIKAGDQVLDVACGTGEWLLACSQRGAKPHGIDLSARAIDACKAAMPDGHFHCQPAESLPFADQQFDVVTCLGSLEHFVDPKAALLAMIKVAKPGARLILLVPNTDFLTRRLGIFSGTYQIDAKEEVRTLEEWAALFESAGLKVEKRWADLHVLSWSWISRSRWHLIPLRALQAVALAVWPLRWQYQVYHLCTLK